MRSLSVTEAADNLDEIVSSAEQRLQRTVIESDGRAAAAVVSLTDLKLLMAIDRLAEVDAAGNILELEMASLPISGVQARLKTN